MTQERGPHLVRYRISTLSPSFPLRTLGLGRLTLLPRSLVEETRAVTKRLIQIRPNLLTALYPKTLGLGLPVRDVLPLPKSIIRTREEVTQAAVLAVKGDAAARVRQGAPDQGVDVSGNVVGDLVAVVVALRTVESAALAAEVLLISDGEAPGVCADEGHEEGEDVCKLHCDEKIPRRRLVECCTKWGFVIGKVVMGFAWSVDDRLLGRKGASLNILR